MLCLYRLYKMKKIEDKKDSIYAIISENNITSFFFPKQVGGLYKEATNDQCINPIVYRQHVVETKEIFGKV